MTQEQFVAEYWPYFITAVGILNPCFMLPQLWKITSTQSAEDVSLIMLSLLMLIQFAFALHGHFIGDTLILFSNLAAGSVTVATTIAAVRFGMRAA